MTAEEAHEVLQLAIEMLGSRWGLGESAAVAALGDTAGDLGVEVEHLAALVVVSARLRNVPGTESAMEDLATAMFKSLPA